MGDEEKSKGAPHSSAGSASTPELPALFKENAGPQRIKPRRSKASMLPATSVTVAGVWVGKLYFWCMCERYNSLSKQPFRADSFTAAGSAQLLLPRGSKAVGETQ